MEQASEKFLFWYYINCIPQNKQQLQNMIQQIWDKRVVAQIQLSHQDVADDIPPLPLFLSMPWNHYFAFYYDQIISFFSCYVLYPWNKDQFHLILQQQNLVLDGTEIIGNLITQHIQNIHFPIKFICKFRSSTLLPQIQIKKHFKYSLKASTAIRNPKLGASLMTLHMSIDNVDKIYQSLVNNDLKEYLGTGDFESGESLGYSFLISKTERVPVRIVGKDFLVERGEKKDTSLGKFLALIFEESKQTQNQPSKEQQPKPQHDQVAVEQGITPPNGPVEEAPKTQKLQNINQTNLEYNYMFKKYSFYLHGVKISRGEYPLSFFQRFCHPDGFLYIFFKENH